MDHQSKRRIGFSTDRTERCLSEYEEVTAKIVYIENSNGGVLLVAVLKLSGTAAAKRYTTIQKLQKHAAQELLPGERPDIYLSLGQLGLEDFPFLATNTAQQDSFEEIVTQYLEASQHIDITHISRSSAKQVSPTARRSGPPTERHMIHCHGSINQAIATQNLATPHLEALGFSWQCVEDVFPAPDTSWIYLKRRRPQTWNQRIIHVAHGTDVESLTESWQTILTHHAMFRSLSVQIPESLEQEFGGAKHLFVTLRNNEDLWYQSITTGLEVESQEDLHDAFLGQWADPLYGPLVHVACVKIRNMNSSALILMGHQAAYDEASYTLMLEDLIAIIKTRRFQHATLHIPNYIQFKDVADQLWLNRNSPESREAALYHATRLKGIGNEESYLWPKQKAVEWFKGTDEGWLMPDGTPGDPELRRPIDAPDDQSGLKEITRSLRIETLKQLQDTHNISSEILLKVAIALFNMRKTGSQTALFPSREPGNIPTSSTESPYHNDTIGTTGPTTNVVLNRIRLSDPNESVLEVLRREQDEQFQLSKYSSAPLFQITELLHPIDREVFFEAIARQSYEIVSSHTADTGVLVQLEKQSFNDVGLTWSFDFPETNCIGLTVSYDDCQLSSAEVLEAVGEVLSAAAWLSNPVNLEKGVGGCDFEDMELYE